MAIPGLGSLTSSQMRNRAVKAFQEQKQLLKGGHQVIPHLKMTEGLLWDAAAEILEKGHGAIPSLPARRIASNINELCGQLATTTKKGEALQTQTTEGVNKANELLAQAQIVIDSASRLCRKG